MVHGYETEAKLFASLAEIDGAIASKVKEAGCAHCAGKLDRADYERKPRGDLGEAAGAYTKRTSFCCRNEGCRHRATPPSLRFLGRKVYVSVLVIVASVVGRSVDLVGRGSRREVAGVPVRTVRRWLEWWSIAFAQGAFWSEAKSLFATPVDEGELPGSVLVRLGERSATTLTLFLRLIAPVTTTSVKAGIVMPV